MYQEVDIGGVIFLIYIDHTYSHGELFNIAIAEDGKAKIQDGYMHGRDADAVSAFVYGHGLERRKSA